MTNVEARMTKEAQQEITNVEARMTKEARSSKHEGSALDSLSFVLSHSFVIRASSFVIRPPGHFPLQFLGNIRGWSVVRLMTPVDGP
jgi:hypothetical protein